MTRRRGRPTQTYVDSLQKKAKKVDYEKLVTACLEAIIQGEKDVIVMFSYITKLPKDFPVGIKEGTTEHNNVHRIKAKRLLAWLYDNGHTTITPEDVKIQRANFSRFEVRLAKEYEQPLDEGDDLIGD